ncbi:hypothetical protein BH10BAC5_BH10BAC5_26960 [soil metagenome]
MKKIFLPIIFILVMTAGCNGKRFNVIDKVFIYSNGPEKQFVAFDDKKIYMKWDDSLGIDAFSGEYSIKVINDTTYTVVLKEKPKYWEKNTWDIVSVSDNEFYSVDSKKHYKFLKSGIELK